MSESLAHPGKSPTQSPSLGFPVPDGVWRTRTQYERLMGSGSGVELQWKSSSSVGLAKSAASGCC